MEISFIPVGDHAKSLPLAHSENVLGIGLNVPLEETALGEILHLH